MKNYISIFLAILSFSSCIKVEDASLCNGSLAPPALASSNFSIASGTNLQVSLLSPSSSLSYYWINPTGVVFVEPSLTYPGIYSDKYGLWSVYAQRGTQCRSDTVIFMVTQSQGGCVTGRDSFSIAGRSYSMSYLNGSSDYTYYEMDFGGAYGSVTVTFGSKPTSAGICQVYPSQYYLNPGECSISFSGSGIYSATGGTLSVQVIGSKFILYFCNVNFVDDSGTHYTTGSGYLEGH